jgi:hypothetical protein
VKDANKKIQGESSEHLKEREYEKVDGMSRKSDDLRTMTDVNWM